jgi:hypothetical protein
VPYHPEKRTIGMQFRQAPRRNATGAALQVGKVGVVSADFRHGSTLQQSVLHLVLEAASLIAKRLLFSQRQPLARVASNNPRPRLAIASGDATIFTGDCRVRYAWVKLPRLSEQSPLSGSREN